MKQLINLQRDSQPGESTPLAGKSAEEILVNKLIDTPINYRPVGICVARTIEAMEEYASQKDNGVREAAQKVMGWWENDSSGMDVYIVFDQLRTALNK